jgi:hypothetical protein
MPIRVVSIHESLLRQSLTGAARPDCGIEASLPCLWNRTVCTLRVVQLTDLVRRESPAVRADGLYYAEGMPRSQMHI